MQHLARVDEVRRAGQLVVSAGGREIGLFAIDDRIVAWLNVCPHMGGPVCQGQLFKRVLEPLDDERRSFGRAHHETDINLVCPWHGVEFDLRTGRHGTHAAFRLQSVAITIDDGEIYAES